jgi:hypothetical protein
VEIGIEMRLMNRKKKTGLDIHGTELENREIVTGAVSPTNGHISEISLGIQEKMQAHCKKMNKLLPLIIMSTP